MRRHAAPEDATLADAQAAAVRLLARREHSVHELRGKLRLRGYPEGLLNDCLQALLDQRLLSDQRFVETFIGSRSERGDGPMKIRAALIQRGISGDLMESALEDANIDWKRQAMMIRQRRFGVGNPREYAERARQARFLQQRGFDAEQIRAALNGDIDDD